MPKKRDLYSSYGQKLISLFAALLFSRQRHSLIELSRMLSCSKQTVLRLVDDIKMSYGVDIEESIENRKKYYRLKRRVGVDPTLNLTESEISVLQMCRAFTEHLLGRKLFEEATQALLKSQAHLPENQRVDSRHFSTFIPGSIDYTGHHQVIRRLIKAMDEKKVCKITYKRVMTDRSKTFYIKPLKIFSHKDTIYLHARMARYPGKPFKEPDFDPLLAAHRVQKLELTERSYQFPEDYDFEKFFNQNFGVIKEEAFEVVLEFTGYWAEYVAERIWSPDQKLTKKKDGTVKLRFSASSEPELISWILSFGDGAKVIKPDWLVEEIKNTIFAIEEKYNQDL
ncbi:MAG: WYL domain-containing protein [Ignavibacteriaceae bacterium]|jgi:predicted DNA-binding transcriptional regulator YafY|nr:WYL domain-containing protein [Ignavibacteriaceae bacterium]